MAYKCKKCGGICSKEGNGKYECPFCGSVFTEEDFEPKRKNVSSSAMETEKGDVGVKVFDRNVNGVLEISTQIGRGSGYLISDDGYAITNSHVVSLDTGKSCVRCSVKVAGETVSAVVVAMGTENNSMHCSNSDLALIKLSYVPSTAIPLRFGKSYNVRTGERIFVIGNSLGFGTCITSGIVSDNDRNGQLMYDCPTNPGNSGGPVFNSDGLVIGTHVAGTSPKGVKVQGMNIAIPASAVIQFLKAHKIKIQLD